MGSYRDLNLLEVDVGLNLGSAIHVSSPRSDDPLRRDSRVSVCIAIL